MASTTYVNNSTPAIGAAWLNEVNALLWDVFNGAATVANARTALDVYSTGEVDTALALKANVTDVDDLSGVTDAATARTNLDVYSTSQVDTQAIVFSIALG